MNVSHEWVVSYIKESCLTWMSYEWVMSETWCLRHSVRHDSFMWDIHTSWMSHVRQGVISHMEEFCRMWLSSVRHEWVMSDSDWVWDMTPSCKTWLIHDVWMFHTNESWLSHCKTWLIHVLQNSVTSDKTHPCETWLLHVRHDSFTWDMTRQCDI